MLSIVVSSLLKYSKIFGNIWLSWWYWQNTSNTKFWKFQPIAPFFKKLYFIYLFWLVKRTMPWLPSSLPRSEKNLWERVLSFPHRGPVHQTQVVRLSSGGLYPLCCLPGPPAVTFIIMWFLPRDLNKDVNTVYTVCVFYFNWQFYIMTFWLFSPPLLSHCISNTLEERFLFYSSLWHLRSFQFLLFMKPGNLPS